ncbi:MAG: helix-hairpin-helix domain-containing protein [Cyanobacteriota bacterium]
MSRNRIIVPFILLFLLPLLTTYAQQQGNNSNVIRRYISPDIYFPRGKVVKLQKLDLNQASLEQLMALPEINEDLALKIMRRRPIRTLEDVIRLPYIDMDRMKIIVKGFANLVVQPLEDNESLKQ